MGHTLARYPVASTSVAVPFDWRTLVRHPAARKSAAVPYLPDPMISSATDITFAAAFASLGAQLG